MTATFAANAGVGGKVDEVKILFVHGALVFDGTWWWHRMVEPLAALGLETLAVELPSCVASPEDSGEALGDMYADADVVRAALDGEDGPVVLVGHSYGGMVITDAAAGCGNVEHLIYVTSVMPESGETMASVAGSREPGPWMDPRPEDGMMGLKTEFLPEAFMHDCDEATVAEALERVTRQPLVVLPVPLPRGMEMSASTGRAGRSLRVASPFGILAFGHPARDVTPHLRVGAAVFHRA